MKALFRTTFGALARELQELLDREPGMTAQQVRSALRVIVARNGYTPSHYCDAENRMIWLALIRLTLRSGVTVQEFAMELGIDTRLLDDWNKGGTHLPPTEQRFPFYHGLPLILKRSIAEPA